DPESTLSARRAIHSLEEPTRWSGSSIRRSRSTASAAPGRSGSGARDGTLAGPVGARRRRWPLLLAAALLCVGVVTCSIWARRCFREIEVTEGAHLGIP